MTATQRDGLERLGERWLIPVSHGLLDPVVVFGRSAPVIIDIGCGMGDTTVVQAQQEPDADILAIDVHNPGIGNLFAHADQAGITNVRGMIGDAVEVLDHMIGLASLSGARVFFPDPWPKLRQQKRRLIQPSFVELLVSRLKPGAFIHCATDDEGYAEQMLSVFADNQALTNPFEGFAPLRDRRPQTKYERRAQRRGHQVRDVWVTVGSAHEPDA